MIGRPVKELRSVSGCQCFGAPQEDGWLSLITQSPGRRKWTGVATNLTAITVWNVPNRWPNVSKLPDLATQGMSKQTKAPLTKPYTRAKTMMPACDVW